MAHPRVTSDPIFRYGISKFQIKADLSSFFIAFEAKSVVALVVFTSDAAGIKKLGHIKKVRLVMERVGYRILDRIVKSQTRVG